jgi:hypothetical protein
MSTPVGHGAGLGQHRPARLGEPGLARPYPGEQGQTELGLEVVDNAVMLAVPGAMDAGLADPLFWSALAFALAVAALAAFPLNRHLITRGKGHALIHAHH